MSNALTENIRITLYLQYNSKFAIVFLTYRTKIITKTFTKSELIANNKNIKKHIYERTKNFY